MEKNFLFCNSHKNHESLLFLRSKTKKMGQSLKTASRQENKKNCAQCENDKSITDLPIEVIELILEFLPPNDLVNLSQTCRRYKHLVPEYFQRKRQCGWIRIISQNGTPNFCNQRKERYETIFRSIIRNVVIDFDNGDSITKMCTFIKDNCSKNIHSLVLDGSFHTEINDNHIEIIRDQIDHLEQLILLYGTFSNIPWNRFTNLRVLYDGSHGDHKWMTEKFHNLRTLYVSSLDECQQNALTKFFRKNIQIEIFSTADVQVIKSIYASNVNLVNFVFYIWLGEEAESMDQIEKCYNQIESIELHVYFVGILNKISRMKKVNTLHWFSSNIREFINMTNQLPYIQCLHIVIDQSTQEVLDKYVKCFPNLCELWICLNDLPVKSANEFVTFFVDGLPKLENLYLRIQGKFKGDYFNLRIRRSSRWSMKNAPIVKIHVPELEKSYYDLNYYYN